MYLCIYYMAIKHIHWHCHCHSAYVSACVVCAYALFKHHTTFDEVGRGCGFLMFLHALFVNLLNNIFLTFYNIGRLYRFCTRRDWDIHVHTNSEIISHLSIKMGRWVENCNMIVVFFPGFDRFIPGFDRIIPDFDRFIPASIPVTGTPPLQSKYTLVNEMCIVLYFEITLLHFIWNKYFFIKKNINSENK